MAAGNRHLGYKEVLNALEERSPGTKAAFLFGFLERGHERFADDADDERDELRPCTVCGAPTPGERLRVLPAARAGRAAHPVDARQRRGDVTRPFAAGDRVLLVDTKRRRHLITLADGRRSSTRTPASLAHDDLIGTPDGIDRPHDARRAPRRGAADARRVRARDAARRAGDLPEGPRPDPRSSPTSSPARGSSSRASARARSRSRCCARSGRPGTSPATRSATTSRSARVANVDGFLGADVPLDVEVRDVYEGIDDRRPRPHRARPARAVAGREARRAGAAPGRHPARVPADDLPGRRAARGARRLAVRHGRDARGAAARLARRGPVGAARPPHGGAHRFPHPRAGCSRGHLSDPGRVNSLDLVVVALVVGAGVGGWRLGFVAARARVGGRRASGS